MTSPITVSYVIGEDNTRKQLLALSDKLSRKTILNAQRAGARVVQRAAKARAPVGDQIHRTFKDRYVTPGFAKRNVITRTFPQKFGGTALVAIGVVDEAFYAAQFIERGFTTSGVSNLNRSVRDGRVSEARASAQDTRKRTRVPARPWLEPSFQSTRSQVLSVFSDKLDAELKKIAI